MIPIRLELENFLSYRRPVELDFTGLQLACIAGENGAGKSSLLDAITWVLFGKCRAPGRDDVVNRQAIAHGEAARVQLDLMLEGQTYRVLRLQPAGKTGLLELQLAVDDGNPATHGMLHWKSLTESTQTQTQARLEEILRMNYETFTNASFLLQGRADEFTVKRPGERKRILGDLLGVSHWESYREEAADRRKELEKELAAVAARLAEIAAELEQEPERQKRLEAAKAEHAAAARQRQAQEQLVQSIQAYEAAVGRYRALIQTLSNGLTQARGAQERLAATRAQRQAERDGFQTILDQAEKIEEAYAAWQRAAADLQAWEAKSANWNRINTQRQQAVVTVERERSRLGQEQAQLQEMRAQAAERGQQREVIAGKLKAAQAEVAALRQQLAGREGLQARLGELQSEMGAIKGDQPRLKQEMQKLKGRQVQLQAEEGGRCPLCDQELTLDHRAAVIAQIEEEGQRLADQFRENDNQLKLLDDELKGVRIGLEKLAEVERALRSAERTETAAQTQLNELDRALAEWEGTHQPRLAAVEARLAEGTIAPEAQAQLAELDTAQAALEYDAEAHAAARKAADELAPAQDAHQRLGEARAALRPLEASLQDLDRQITEQQAQTETLEKQRAEAQVELEQLGPAPAAELILAERELNQLREQEVVASKSIGAAEQALHALAQSREQRTRLADQRKEVAQTIGQLKTLERAFGRNGVQALLIDQALPAIEESANQLLDRLTGGEMRVTFSTQRQLKSRDALAETLDIHIADNAGERPYEMYSGGEAFRVNFAIRIALSRLLAQRAGARLQTLVVDEGFGSQDPEGRQRLIEAINTIRPDFAKVLVITHIDELKEAFPARIEVIKGPDGSQINLI